MTTSMPTSEQRREVIIGVDAHKHAHVAVVIDVWGIRLEDRSFAADSGGYGQMIEWAGALGPIDASGIEGTGSYGAGLPARGVGPDIGSSRSTEVIAVLDGPTGSPTPSTPSWPPAPCWRVSRLRCPRPPMVRWR